MIKRVVISMCLPVSVDLDVEVNSEKDDFDIKDASLSMIQSFTTTNVNENLDDDAWHQIMDELGLKGC
jgi:hypothetical protein